MATADDDSDDSTEDMGCRKDCKKSVARCIGWFKNNFDIVQICHEICKISLLVMFWLICYSAFGNFIGPTSDFFKLLVLFSSAEICGQLVEHLKIPSVMGMLAVGVIFKNVGYVDITGSCYGVVIFLRQMSLIAILLPAAFTLDPKVVKQEPILIITLALFPAVVEIGTWCVFSYFFLPPTWLWSLLLGFIISAASPLIVIPCLFVLEDKGYGNINGIHTLITAAGILNVILAITLYGLVYGILTAEPSEALKTLTRGPIEVMIAVVYGIAVGYIAQYIPHDDDWFVSTLRTVMVLFGSILSLSGSYAVGYPGAGMLGCFVFAFVANLRWCTLGWGRHNPVRENFKILWRILEPMCFSLFGIEIDFKYFHLMHVLYGGAGTLLGTLSHFIARVFITTFFKFNFRERVFIGLTWIPKASVQAVLAPLPLTFARMKGPVETYYSETIIWVTFVSILITVPLGIILLLALGPKLLTKDTVTPDQMLSKSSMAQVAMSEHEIRAQKRRLSWIQTSQDD